MKINIAGLVTSALWVCSAASAQTSAPATPASEGHSAAATESQAALTKGEIKAMREFKMLDFNGDGKLSRTEVKLFPRLAAAFDEADTDRDGYVSYAEVQVFAAKYRAERDRLKAAQAAQTAQTAPTQQTPPATPEKRP